MNTDKCHISDGSTPLPGATCSALVDMAIADYVAMLERQNKYCRGKIERLTALLEATRQYRIGHEVPMDWFIKRDQEIGNPAVVTPNPKLRHGGPTTDE